MTPRHVVVAGGGVGALEAVLALRELAGERVVVTLLAPDRHFTYRPLSVGAPFGLGATVRYELADVARELGVVLVRDAVDEVDPDARRLLTQDRSVVRYDALLLALGAQPRVAIPGAVPFRGPRDVERIAAALQRLRDLPGARVAFVVPPGSTWTLPVYELALLTGAWVQREGLDVELVLVTPERAPLEIFGDPAAERTGELLAERGVTLRTASFADGFAEGRLWMTLEGSVPVDVAIALPRLVGPSLPGVPRDEDGFVPADGFGRVLGTDALYAVGDMTQGEIKQGGITAQQADAAAAAIAAWAGAPVASEPCQNVLRGLLLTGGEPLWLRHGAAPQRVDDAATSDGPLWWPPHKIAGRRLSPWLAAHEGLAEVMGPPSVVLAA